MKKFVLSLLFLFFIFTGCSFGEEGTKKVLFVFENEDAVEGWVSLNDNVMGGISSGGILWENDLAVFKGSISLANNGGFSSIRSPELVSDISAFNGLSAMVRGDGREYAFTL